MKKILLILIAAFVFQLFVFGEEVSHEEPFEQNETSDMKDSFSKNDALGLDSILWEKPKAQFSLGSMYLYGEGVEQDLEKARYWIEKSVEQGNLNAQYCLGEFYYYGDAVERERAKYWWEKDDAQKKEEAE